MDRYCVKCGSDSLLINADDLRYGDNGLTFSIDGETIANFTSWDYWYKYVSLEDEEECDCDGEEIRLENLVNLYQDLMKTLEKHKECHG